MAISRALGSGRGVTRGLAIAIGIPPELAEPAGEHAIGAMMALKQAREAGGGMLRDQYLFRAQRHIAPLDPARHGILAQHLQAHALALQGRGADTEIAHVTPGEAVVPKRLQNSEFLRGLEVLARAYGIDPASLRVGSGRNAINPRTGQMEFDDSNDGVYDDGGNPIENVTVPAQGPSDGLPIASDYLQRPPLASEDQGNDLSGQWISAYTSPEQAKAMQAPPLTIGARTAMGMDDPYYGAAQSLVNVPPTSWLRNAQGILGPYITPTADQLGQQIQQREADYQARRDASGQSGMDFWRSVGRGIGEFPIDAAVDSIGDAMGVYRAEKILEPVVSGAAKSLLEPETDGDDNFWVAKGKQAAIDAADELSKSQVLQWIKDEFR